MYPLTHLFFAKRVLGFLDDPVALGSIFPDVLILSSIGWKESHSLGIEIWRHFRGKEKTWLTFLWSNYHGIEPKGLTTTLMKNIAIMKEVIVMKRPNRLSTG